MKSKALTGNKLKELQALDKAIEEDERLIEEAKERIKRNTQKRHELVCNQLSSAKKLPIIKTLPDLSTKATSMACFQRLAFHAQKGALGTACVNADFHLVLTEDGPPEPTDSKEEPLCQILYDRTILLSHGLISITEVGFDGKLKTCVQAFADYLNKKFSLDVQVFAVETGTGKHNLKEITLFIARNDVLPYLTEKVEFGSFSFTDLYGDAQAGRSQPYFLTEMDDKLHMFVAFHLPSDITNKSIPQLKTFRDEKRLQEALDLYGWFILFGYIRAFNDPKTDRNKLLTFLESTKSSLVKVKKSIQQDLEESKESGDPELLIKRGMDCKLLMDTFDQFATLVYFFCCLLKKRNTNRFLRWFEKYFGMTRIPATCSFLGDFNCDQKVMETIMEGLGGSLYFTEMRLPSGKGNKVNDYGVSNAPLLEASVYCLPTLDHKVSSFVVELQRTPLSVVFPDSLHSTQDPTGVFDAAAFSRWSSED